MHIFQLSVKKVGCVVLMAMLGGCMVGPDFVRPTPPNEESYTHELQPQSTVIADGQAQNFISGASVPKDWWELFKSAPLDAVVQQSIINNPTLQASEASLRQSQDELRAGYGVFFPQAQAGLSGGRQRVSPLQQGSQAPSTIFNLVTISGTVSYALDVFGGERRTVESLQAQADYQRYESKAAYLALTANVVNTSIARSAYASQISSTKELIALEKEQLRLTEAQVSAGMAPYQNVLNVQSLIASNQALLAPLEQNASQAGHLLATLEGLMPSKADLTDIELTGLLLPSDLPLSLPSELVRQRPDILAAEAQMHVASAKIGIATAAMFPSFSLSGTYGSAGSANLPALGSTFWSIGPSVTVPLLNGGSLWYGRKAAIDAYQQSQANYRQVVLGAFAQVADSLKALEHDAQALQAQVEAKRVASQTLKLSQENYRAGMVSYLDVLVADVQLHEATISYLQITAQRYQDTVALFAALGGGWWNDKLPADKGVSP